MNGLAKIRFLVGILLCLSVIAPVLAQTKADREELEYKGKVRNVRTESISFTYDDGKRKAEKRRLDQVETFDIAGNLLRNIVYSSDLSVLYDEKRSFQKGRVVETLRKHSPFTYLSDRVLYKYDQAGDLVEENGFDLTGKLVSHHVYEYDNHGRKTQWTSRSYFANEDKRVHRWTYTYDGLGRVRDEKAYIDGGNGFIPTDELGGPHRKLNMYADSTRSNHTVNFNARGVFVGSRVSRYDRKGNELEDIGFDEKGELKEKTRYEYVFDRLGNWTVKRTYEWDFENGKGLYRLEEISYRRISFYTYK